RHLGANHYYIHAVEASPHPERALQSANVLPTLAPAAGHIVHMPAHVYMRTGDYPAAVRANAAAAAVDRDYLKRTDVSALSGVYPALYYTHNLHFLTASQGMAGQSAAATRAAATLATQARTIPADGPMMPLAEYFVPVPT